MQHTPLRPSFRPFRSTVSRFLVTPLFFGKVHRMTPNDIDMLKVKNTNMHATYTLKAQIFISFALYDEPFSSCAPFFGKLHKMTLNDLDMFKVTNAIIHAAYTPRGPGFRLFHSTMSRFWVTPLFRKNAAPNAPQRPWHVQGKKYPYACYIQPRGRDICPFHSTMSRFRVTLPFQKSAPNDSKTTLTCSRSGGPPFRLFWCTMSRFRGNWDF